MVHRKTLIFIGLILLLPLFFSLDAPSTFAQNGVIEPSTPTNVYIEEEAAYDAPIGDNRPIMHLKGILYWERLAGIELHFFINTSDIIEYEFWDYETGAPINQNDNCGALNTGCLDMLDDRFRILPEGKSFTYTIDAYYDPDIIQDTGFIVIFNSQSVDFSMVVDGEEVFAAVDYKNTITLPRGAGIVSYAPIDEGFKGLNKTQDGRFMLTWEYKNRAMDTKHEPLMIEVTYAYDEIYLAFTEQIYQNQQVQQERLEEQQRLDLLNATFLIIATLAIVASLISIFFAYLLARQKFEPKLNQARELPRRAVSDIEVDGNLKLPTKSLFLSAIILVPFFLAPGSVAYVDNYDNNMTGLADYENPYAPIIPAQIESDKIIMEIEMDLIDRNELVERATLTFPSPRSNLYVYTNTSAIEEGDFQVTDELGNPLVYTTEDNRFKISNPPLTVNYELTRPYIVYDNNQMLVFMDRIWSEFVKPAEFIDPESGDIYFNVDLKYSVILPAETYLYSASPSDIMEISKTNTGRWNVTFTSLDRRMDAFHDVFEMQVTYSYVSILEALENLNVDFQQELIIINETQDYIDIARNEVLLFALLGLLAPLISFLIAYWVFRKRYQNLIEQMEKKMEENIFVERPQIEALSVATQKSSTQEISKSIIGHYWHLLGVISRIIKKEISIQGDQAIIHDLRRHVKEFDETLLLELLVRGRQFDEEEPISYDELFDYAKLVNLMVDDLLS